MRHFACFLRLAYHRIQTGIMVNFGGAAAHDILACFIFFVLGSYSAVEVDESEMCINFN